MSNKSFSDVDLISGNMEQEDKIKIEEASVNLGYLKKEFENEQGNNLDSLIGVLDDGAVMKTESVDLDLTSGNMEHEDKIKIEEASVNLGYLKKEFENEQRNNLDSLIGVLDDDAIMKTESVDLDLTSGNMEHEDKIKIEEASVNLGYLKKEFEKGQTNNADSLIGFLDGDAMMKTESVELYRLEIIQCHYCKVCFEEWEHLENHMLHCLDENSNRLYETKLDTQQKPADELEETQGNGEISSCSTLETINSKYADGISKACKSNLKRHLSTHSNDKFECDVCKKRFNRKDHLNRHIMSIHSNINEKKYKCSKCSYQTNRKDHLHRHLNTHDNSRPFECDNCKNRFTRKDYLKMHVMDIHSNSNEKKYKCTECSYQTDRKDKLKTHLNAHYNYKPFECHTCKKRFTKKCDLKRHIMNMHLNTNEKKYKCTECSYQTDRKRHLNVHLNTH